MNQQERRQFLIRRLLDEQPGYREMAIPSGEPEQRKLLRSLFNVRMPVEIGEDFLNVQDDYLRKRISENGIVQLTEIPVIRDGLSLWQGDITRLAVDAIVNAANSQMLGCFVPMHSCIDNCIHSFAGVQLRAECGRQMDQLRAKYGRDYEQPTAVPMLTDAYNLPAKKIVHIVGPIVSGRLTPEAEDELAACYRNTLDLCAENGLRSVAFCCISTGVFGFPQQRAAEIAVETVTAWLDERGEQMDRVIFNVFTDKDRDLYAKLLQQ